MWVSIAKSFSKSAEMFSIVAAIFAFHLSMCGAGDPCPPKQELSPCTCTHTQLKSETTTPPRPRRSAIPVESFPENKSFYTVVECKGLKTPLALEDVVSNGLYRKWVDKLIVVQAPTQKEHTVARLPSNWLKNVRVRNFEVHDSILSGDFIWYGSPFRGQAESLLWLTAKKCLLSGSLTYDTIGTINTQGINTLPHIEGVDLSHNQLTLISSTAFRYPSTNLSSVNLSWNSVQVVHASAFAYILQLSHVDLSHNLLEAVQRNIFATNAKDLQYIDLSWNMLTSLPVDFFTNMPALKVVNISSNFLYSMPDKPWSIVWKQLTFLNISGNFVECDCNIKWLLPISSPQKANATPNPSPTPIPGPVILGRCLQTIQPQLITFEHEISTLAKDHINC